MHMNTRTPWILLCVLGAGLPAAGAAQERTIDSSIGPLRVETVAEGLEHPWGLEFLPDGRMLVTERPGRLRLVTADGLAGAPVAGVPAVFAEGQGGLLDVALDPAFAKNQRVYISYAEPGGGGASTAVARGRLVNDALRDVQVIFRQQPKLGGGSHFGSRLVFAPDGNLFITTGERFKFDPAQDLSNTLGKILRVRPDGSTPDDNPFTLRPGVPPAIWSYGHRNVQAAAMHPHTGKLWAIEHGPRGGDELNIVEAGRNYGWPLVSWGRHYNLRGIPDPDTRPDLAQSIYQWTPVIAPSGMMFYTAGLFPDWQGDILVGGLVAKAIVRLTQDGKSAEEVERIELNARIRDVVQGPDGAIYALTDEDNGAILRIAPAARAAP
jgi:glucose/arabinose dehydrogenase